MPTLTADRAVKHVNKPLHLTKRIGSTTYKVSVHFSRTSRETIDDKLTILYERLSHEDGRENESLSIEHQEGMSPFQRGLNSKIDCMVTVYHKKFLSNAGTVRMKNCPRGGIDA